MPDSENLVNPLDIQKKQENSSDLVQGIVSAQNPQQEANFLETAPEIDMSLLQDVGPPRSILLIFFKIFFVVLAGISFVSVLFFTSQLTNFFDFIETPFGVPNISKQLTSTNTEIINLQTDLNFYRYLEIKAYLDELSYYGDSYLQNFEIANSQTSTNEERKEAADMLLTLRDHIKNSFNLTKKIFLLSFSAPLFSDEASSQEDEKVLFQQNLINKLNSKSQELVNINDPQAKREYKNYINTINLVGNNNLLNLIVQTDFDALTEEDLYMFIKNINSLIVNDLSVIQKIKDTRIKWSDIINEIELRTMAVDGHYTDDFYNELGGIRYTNYDFDTASRTVSIVGETKRFDTTNFTMIANLIDELNRSDFFDNAEMKSFSKSGSLNSGYTASLKLNLNLQEGYKSSQDQQL